MSYLYPYGDTQQLNLSWFLAKFKELYEYILNLDPDDIALATVLSRFTNEYNSSTNYIPGDYTIHEGFIYKANQSTTGNFNPEAWDAALPVNDIQGLRILLGGISRDLTDLAENAVTDVQYTPGAASADGLLRQTKNGTAETVMTVDKEPTANSQNPVKSGAVQAGIAAVSQAVGSERTDRQNADTSLQNQIDDLENITGDGSLTGFTATDLTGAANELKGSLNSVQGQITANIETSTTATKAYNAGDYLVLNETLYKVISPIANGAQITINTNVIAKNICEELNTAVKTLGFLKTGISITGEQNIGEITLPAGKWLVIYRIHTTTSGEVAMLINGTVTIHDTALNLGYVYGYDIAAPENETVYTLSSNSWTSATIDQLYVECVPIIENRTII